MKISNDIDVCWPALRFGSPNCTVWRCDSRDELFRRSLKGIKSIANMDYYFIVDSKGQKISLSEPHLEVELGWFRKLWALITNSKVQIAYHNVQIGTVTVDELREMIFQEFEEYFEFWVETDLPRFKAQLKEATTHREIIEFF